MMVGIRDGGSRHCSGRIKGRVLFFFGNNIDQVNTVVNNFGGNNFVRYGIDNNRFFMTQKIRIIYIHTYIYIYIYIYIYSQSLEKIQLDFNWILNFVSHVLFNF